MTVPCPHPRTGRVESVGDWGKHAQAPVCGAPECVAEAREWVRRVTGKPTRHVLDEVVGS